MNPTDQSHGAPRVFLSHASEDKERFAIPFARALRKNGIDVWLDKWELLPGDSLVDKIFEEGLREATAVVIVLSKFSVDKKWVREELNAAIVNKINKQTKIIPVLIDACEVPEALKSTVWETVTNLSQMESVVQSVTRAVFDLRPKPPIGEPPAYLKIVPIMGLTSLDTAVLRSVYERAIERNSTLLDVQEIQTRLKEQGVEAEDVLDSLEILESRGLLELKRVLGGVPRGIRMIKAGVPGFQEYADNFLPNASEIARRIALELLNQGSRHSEQIAKNICQPPLVIEFFLGLFESNAWLSLSRTMGGTHVVSVSPLLKRQFGK